MRNECTTVSILLTDLKVITLTIEGTLMLTILFGNLFVAVIVLYTPHLRTFTNVFILSLTASDLFSGVAACMAFVFLLRPKLLLNTDFCKVKYAPLILWWVASVHSLLAVTLDRYIAITRPLHYATIVTKPRVCFALSVIWVYSLCIALSSLIFKSKDGFRVNTCDLIVHIPGNILTFCSCNMVVVVAVITFCYWRIFLVAKSQSCRVVPGIPERPRNWKNFFQEKKYAWSIFLIMLLILFSWVPLLSMLFAEIWGKHCSHTLQTSRVVASLICQTSSILNPLIFTWRNKKFKDALKQFRSKQQKSSTSIMLDTQY